MNMLRNDRYKESCSRYYDIAHLQNSQYLLSLIHYTRLSLLLFQMPSSNDVAVPYMPNKPAAIAGSAIFLVLTILHTWRIVQMRKWFGLAILFGGICK
jgi:hypothetical protein